MATAKPSDGPLREGGPRHSRTTTFTSLGPFPDIVSGGSIYGKEDLYHGRPESSHANNLLLDAVLHLTAFGPASLAALSQIFCMVLPLPVHKEANNTKEIRPF